LSVSGLELYGLSSERQFIGMWDTLNTAFDRSSGTLGTVGGRGWGRYVA